MVYGISIRKIKLRHLDIAEPRYKEVIMRTTQTLYAGNRKWSKIAFRILQEIGKFST